MAIKRKQPITSDPGADPGRNMKTGRRVAGFNVALAVGAAAALLIVANWISDRHGWRRNVERLGRYRLSDTAKRILDQVDRKVRLTSIYTATAEDRKAGDYLPRVRDLFAEIDRYSGQVTTVNVTSDRQKSEVLNRLRDRLETKAGNHRKVIRDFRALARIQLPQYEKLQGEWQAYPTEGWLTQFGVAKAFVGAFKDNRDDLNKAAGQVRAGLSGSGLPDYPDMVGKIETTLKNVRGRLESIAELMARLKDLPGKSDKAKAELLKSVAALTAATAKVVETAGKGGAEAPEDPSAVLEELAKASVLAADAAQAAVAAMNRFNTECGGYAEVARSWRVRGVPLPHLAAGLALTGNDLAEQARNIRAAAKVEVQKQFITQIRPELPKLTAQVERIAGAAAELVRELAAMDPATKAIFERTGKDGYLQAQIKPVADLLEGIGDVGELSDQSELIDQIGQDNIVLVEVGEKVGVVGFDDVWPLAERRSWDMPEPEDEEGPRRTFNGDTAISSKILSLSAEPLGEVVLAFFGPIPSVLLDTLKQRLEKANLTVTEWNLADADAPPEPAEGRARVLLILPPPPPRPMPPMGRQQAPPQWEPEHTQRLTKVIDDGTPAIFLAMFMKPQMQMFGPMQPTPYLLNDYLKDSWGVEARTQLRLVQAVEDASNPGRYKLPVVAWTWVPLSTFTDHPVGKPLRARRMHWLDPCPVVRAEDADGDLGVTVRDILAVPKGMDGMWAASNAIQLAMKAFGGRGAGLTPGDAPGDLLPPFAMGVEASKTVEGQQRRIIVLGVGRSYIDPFLTTRVPQIAADATVATDPPPTNDVDLVINSAYYLTGQDRFIGSGPSPTPRIQHIEPAAMAAIKVTFGLAWPLLIMAVGGVVMAVRKR
ncbi:MAG: hypothetical protein ACYS5V_01170 [Planctomycetota bacterium]|jgi:hypothetical protein